jgi:ubiquinone/menaquinone biosynthesis C-methylase UbiE
MGDPAELDAFRDFERAAHDRIAHSYHDAFSVVTGRAIGPLLDAARVGKGTRLLDVAAGPGTLTVAAAKRGARATGVDLAPAMVAMAGRLHAGVNFRVASGEELPFAEPLFDAVVCSFGLGHFSAPERVISEFARVLAPGGFAALSWWQDFTRNRINGLFHQAVMKLGITAAGAVPPGPPMDRYSDRDRFAELLRSAGFEDVRIDEVSFSHRLRDADELWTLAMGSFARVSSVIRAQTPQVQQRIRMVVTEMAHEYASKEGLDIPVAFWIGSGRRG